MTTGDTLYCGDNCNHTGPHRYPGVAEAIALAHHHRWVYDGTLGNAHLYHCDDHDPPLTRLVPFAATWSAS